MGTGQVWGDETYTHIRTRILTNFFHTCLKFIFATRSGFKWDKSCEF